MSLAEQSIPKRQESNPGGDLPRPYGKGFYRKVITITAEDSPNVRFALAEIAKGKEPSNTVVIPGVLTWREYQKRRRLWDRVRQCIGLDGRFYKGGQVLLYPPDWLNLAALRNLELVGSKRQAKTMGIDSAMGGDKTTFAVCDDLGLMYLESLKTPDTSIIPGHTLALATRFGIPPQGILFDHGGGGKQHADALRKKGYAVRVIGFGESPSPPIRHGTYTVVQRVDQLEHRSLYRNRRAEMYGMLSDRLNPSMCAEVGRQVFALPVEYNELRRQLSPIPRLEDGEGQMYLPPKNRQNAKGKRQTMTDLIGCSPDEADALVLAVFGLENKTAGYVVKAV